MDSTIQKALEALHRTSVFSANEEAEERKLFCFETAITLCEHGYPQALQRLSDEMNDEWQQHNAALLAQAEDEHAAGHLWEMTVLLATYHDSEAKRELVAASREEMQS